MFEKRLSLLLAVLLVGYTGFAISHPYAMGSSVSGLLLFPREDRFDQRIRDQLWLAQLGTGDIVSTLEKALAGDQACAYRWCDLADALSLAGQTQRATLCYTLAVKRAPQVPSVLLRAANFLVGTGQTLEALPLVRRVLSTTRAYDEAVFSVYDRLDVALQDILGYGIPRRLEPAKAFFRHIVRNGSTDDLNDAWNWLVQNRLHEDLLRHYLDELMQRDQYEHARRVLSDYTRSSLPAETPANLVFNPSFEFAPIGTVLDWKIYPSAHAVVTRDSTTAKHGLKALRIEFDGRENLPYHHVVQWVIVDPGRYRFQASIRTEDITSDEGLRFRIFDPKLPARLDVSTRCVTGTHEWRRDDLVFSVRSETRIIAIQFVRRPARKLDNRLGGRAWIDQVSIVPL